MAADAVRTARQLRARATPVMAARGGFSHPTLRGTRRARRNSSSRTNPRSAIAASARIVAIDLIAVTGRTVAIVETVAIGKADFKTGEMDDDIAEDVVADRDETTTNSHNNK